MSWLNLNQSLNSLKGQITNFASEVLSEGVVQDAGDNSAKTDVPEKDLELKCHNQELEIAALKKLNSELEAALQSEKLSRKNGVKDEESSWYWDPPSQSRDQNQYESQLEALKREISSLKERNSVKIAPDTEYELNRLREENKNLTTNLEDLDNQHQLAMERLLSLKKELQKNFEILKQEHEDLKNSNDEYAAEKQILLAKISEKDKEIEELKKHISDYETLHHKYLNLEKVHSNLRENAEQFQEENQELHEEIFKLQERVTKYEHEFELATKHSELSNMVPRENYDELLKELSELKDQKMSNKVHFEETNIDDNAKSVIESLKREIRELKLKLSQKDSAMDNSSQNIIKAENVMQLYNKYINFELPTDRIDDVPSSADNIVLFKLENTFKALNTFKKDIDTLEHQLAEKRHDINNMEVQLFDLTNENDFLSSDILQFQTELKEMKKNNDFLINEIAVIKNSSKLEPIIETHEENVAKLESELDDCNKINKNFESEIKRIEQVLTEVKSEKKVLEESLKDMRNKYKTMLNELETFKNQTNAFESGNESEHKNKLKRAVDEIDELKKKLTSSNAKNEQLSIDIHILENDKLLLAKQVEDLNHQLSDTLTAHKELENLKIILDKKLENVENQLDDVVRHNRELEDVKQKLQEKLLVLENTNKTNELAAVEFVKETSERNEKLDQVLQENTMLKEAVEKLTTEITQIKQSNVDLNTKIDECKDCTVLNKTIEELKTKIESQKTLHEEVTKMEENKKTLIEKNLKLEAELVSTDAKIVKLEEDFEKLVSELNEKDSIIDNLKSTVSDNNSTINNLNNTINSLNTTLVDKNKETEKISQALDQNTKNLKDITARLHRSFDELKHLELEKSELQNQVMNFNDEIESKNSHITKLENITKELELKLSESTTIILDKDKEIKELNQSIVELTDKIKTFDNCSQLNDEHASIVKEKEVIEKEFNDLRNDLFSKEIELSDLRSKSENLVKSLNEHKNAIENATKEKGELINLINLKHNESIQYHNEIQRLNQVLLEQTNEFKRVIEEKDKLIQNVSEKCTNCENLKMTLKEKDEIIIAQNQNTTDYERIKTELVQANETIKNLTERCDSLDRSLAVHLETVKKLTAENAQLSEQEQNSSKELERLRRHLVETEENYTMELMTSEQKLSECQARLHQVEERAKQTSTVYTSNSIRANQEVETLRNQIKLLEKQREDVQTRLSNAEDERSRSEAALTNLQIVLEQFQLDKEREIKAATEKIRSKMEDIKNENLSLRNEIDKLNVKLEKSLAGLQAASRLGDQVETKTAQINDLKEQVSALQMSVAAAEERYHNATSNQQDKVDKNLVKNLVINYVVNAANNASNKTQVLRILSTVLDFNQQECEKLGLVRASTATDSLAAEFVKFLQNESKPRSPLPNMMGIANDPSRSTTPVSRKNSTMGPNPIVEMGHQRNLSSGSNNLLFQNLDNVETSSQISIESDSSKRTLETGVTQPRGTEGAILKHVLRDM